MVIRSLALFLSLAIGLPAAPAFALRNQTTEGAWLEEKLTQALQGGDPVKAVKTVVSHFAQVVAPPKAPVTLPVAGAGLEEKFPWKFSSEVLGPDVTEFVLARDGKALYAIQLTSQKRPPGEIRDLKGSRLVKLNPLTLAVIQEGPLVDADASIAVSPDGRHLFAIQDGFLVRIATGSLQVTGRGPSINKRRWVLSPDGSVVYAVAREPRSRSRRKTLLVIDIMSKQMQVMAESRDEPWKSFEAFEVSPQGDLFVYEKRVTGGVGMFWGKVYRLARDGSSLTVRAASTEKFYWPHESGMRSFLSPDGRYFYGALRIPPDPEERSHHPLGAIRESLGGSLRLVKVDTRELQKARFGPVLWEPTSSSGLRPSFFVISDGKEIAAVISQKDERRWTRINADSLETIGPVTDVPSWLAELEDPNGHSVPGVFYSIGDRLLVRTDVSEGNQAVGRYEILPYSFLPISVDAERDVIYGISGPYEYTLLRLEVTPGETKQGGLEERPTNQTPFAKGKRLAERLAPYGVRVWQGLVQADDPSRVASTEQVVPLVERPEGMEFTLDIPMGSPTIKSLPVNLPEQFTLWVHPTLKDSVPAQWGVRVETLPENLGEARTVLREKVRAGDLVLLDKRNYDPSVHRSWKAILAEEARQGLWVAEGELSTMDRDEFAITLQILRNSGEVLPMVGPEQEIEGTQHRFIYA